MVRWIKWLAVLLLPVLLIGVAWWTYCLIENKRGEQAWADVRSKLTAQGEQLDWESFVPEPVPDEVNFAATPFLQSVAYKNNQDSRLTAKISEHSVLHLREYMADLESGELPDWVAMAKVVQEKLAPYRKFEATDPARIVQERLSPLDPQFQELRDAVSRPYSQFKVNQFDPIQTSGLDFVVLREIAFQLALLASVHLETGNSNLALQDIHALIACAEGVCRHPSFVDFMVGSAVMEMALPPIWKGMTSNHWDKHQLLKLDHLLGHIDLLTGWNQSLRAERARSNRLVEQYNSVGQIMKIGGSSLKPSSLHGEFTDYFFAEMAPYGWVRHSQVLYNKDIQSYALNLFDPKIQVVDPAIVEGKHDVYFQSLGRRNPRQMFYFNIMPFFKGAFQRTAKRQTLFNLCRVAIAIELHRRMTGSIPQHLDELTNSSGGSLPHDLIGGGPLRYRANPDGTFRLWSIGWNQIDDGGDVSSDWVWLGEVDQN